MQREGCDPENMQAQDFLCDFCGQHWAEDRPMMEGHQGSLICGNCLTVAYTECVLGKVGEPGKCVMCLEDRDEACWRSPVREEGVICRRCARQSATGLERDPDSAWVKPKGDDA